MTDETKQLQDKAKDLRVGFDALRSEITEKLTKCNEKIHTIEEFLEEVVEKKTKLDNKLASLSNDEKEWSDIKEKLATTIMEGRVTLNVGGDRFVTNVETLTREKNTFFTALFSKQWKLELDPDDKSIFIDRDGKSFSYILSYLRTDYLPTDVVTNESLRQLLMIEAKYFRLSGFLDRLVEAEQKQMIETSFTGGSLLMFDHKKVLNEFYGKPTQNWTLLYKASRDGFGGSVFHTKCNNKGPTMTVILSNNNYLFGGYTTVPWTSDGSFKNDTTAFLFTLTNPHNIVPTKYLINAGLAGNAVLHNGSYGPIFGASHDIIVHDNSNANNSSFTSFPSTYLDTTGYGNNTFTGAKNFTVSDIEVYQLAN